MTEIIQINVKMSLFKNANVFIISLFVFAVQNLQAITFFLPNKLT